jgi:fibronectin-binding autotransporter adhesin
VLVEGAYSTVADWLDSGKGRLNTASAGALALTGNSSEAINTLGSYTNLSLGSIASTAGDPTTGYAYSGTLTPVGGTYRFGGGGGTLTVSPELSGSNNLVTSGNVTLTYANTYSGGDTTINAGTLKLSGSGRLPSTTAVTLANTPGAVLDLNSNSQTIGSLTGGGNVGGNILLGSATLTVGNTSNTNYSGIISGTGAVVKQGSGSLILGGSSSNTYSGTTTVNAGSLQLNKTGGAVAVAGNITLLGTDCTSSGGNYNTLSLGGDGEIASTSTITFNPAAGNYPVFNLNSHNVTVAGISDTTGRGYIQDIQVGDGGTGTLTVNNSADCTFNGTIQNYQSGTDSSLALVKSGSGTLTLGGTNWFKGGLTVNGGTLKMDNAYALGSTGATQTVTVNANSAIDVNGWTPADYTNPLTINSGGVAGTGALLNSSASNGGSSKFAVFMATDSSIGVTGAGNLTLGTVSGYSLNKVGSGTGALILGGTNTYTGMTTVSSGKLIVNGFGAINSSSGITLNGGTLLQDSSTAMTPAITFTSGTFGGTGQYTGNLSPGSCHLSPGDGGIGTLTEAGNLSLSAASILDYDFGTTAGSCDLFALSGASRTLVLDGTINITCSGSLPAGNYTIFSGATTITDNGLILPADGYLGHHWSYSISNGSVIVTAAPEPGALLLLTIGLSCLLGYAWRKWRK